MTVENLPPELLMPAGNFEKLKFAFSYGADAVYAGVPIFSLRARENDFTQDTIQDAIEFTHRLGKRIYLTMNIYAHNLKVDKFLYTFQAMSDLQPDGFIMTDPGLIHQSLKLRPESVIHLSTQANATNWATVAFWRDLGVKRIILPRELSIKEMVTMHEKVPDIELESFVHGSICIAYSGRCLISNYLNHRDANQGTCTNSCRWEYSMALDRQSLLEMERTAAPSENYKPLVASYFLKEAKRVEKQFIEEQFEIDEDEYGTYLMNSKDLCAIELLKELHNAGIGSFKVEGRSKSIYYVAIVARAYRRAIDDLVNERPFDRTNLQELFSTSNRTLMTGFMMRKPQEYGENFDDGDSLPLTHRFAGVVQDYDAITGQALVDFKNRVEVGEWLEWISPTKSVKMKVEAIFRANGAAVDAAHGGVQFKTPAPFEPDTFTLVRQPLTTCKHKQKSIF
ncbi:MAG: U32 family peptidase C-terminal domain-containing protein [bacterium]